MIWIQQSISHGSGLNTVSGQNPYAVLGIDETADFETLKEAYYKLMSMYYPRRTDPVLGAYYKQRIALINRCLDEIKGAINGR